jgi:hypothetical protein
MVQKLTGRIRLQSVLNLRPWGLFKLQLPNPYPQDAAIYHRLWKKAFETVGLDSLEPIQQGSSHVAVSQLTDDVLQHLQKATRHVSEHDRSEYMEWASGEMLLHNSDVILEPQCCSELASLAEWEDVAKYRESEWAMVWIGHPWIYMKYENGWLYFTDYTEDKADKATILYAIEPDKIAHAVTDARPETEAFLERYNKYFGRK